MSELPRTALLEITEWEMKHVVPLFINAFNGKIPGKESAVTSTVMCKKINIIFADNKIKYTLTASKVRQIIRYFRESNIIPEFINASSSKGYWKETDECRVEEYIDSLEKRANDILFIVKAGRRWVAEKRANKAAAKNEFEPQPLFVNDNADGVTEKNNTNNDN